MFCRGCCAFCQNPCRKEIGVPSEKKVKDTAESCDTKELAATEYDGEFAVRQKFGKLVARKVK